MSTIPEIRTLPVPDGLEGERVDAAISRMFGFSRTKAAELAAAGFALLWFLIIGCVLKVREDHLVLEANPEALRPVLAGERGSGGLPVVCSSAHDQLLNLQADRQPMQLI